MGQIDYFDSGYPGLALRVSCGGRKSWNYIYRIRGQAAPHDLLYLPCNDFGRRP